MSIRCVAVRLEDLDAHAQYALWQLRQQVFVVEQQCPYPDLDGWDLDPETRHVLLTDDTELLGCARVLDEDRVWRIGRVALDRDARGQGLADVIMHTALNVCPRRDVVLDAQAPLAGWYSTFGFEVVGPEFLEDGIPHLPMRRPADSA